MALMSVFGLFPRRKRQRWSDDAISRMADILFIVFAGLLISLAMLSFSNH